MKKIVFLVSASLLFPIWVLAQISLPNVFSDNMVLQQGKKVNVWGTAPEGETVVVKFGKQSKKTKADANGCWKLQLDELQATAKPQTMTVRGKKAKVTFKNVLVGEVWLASGQSNMEYSMNNHPRYAKPERGNKERLAEEYRSADNPHIRVNVI